MSSSTCCFVSVWEFEDKSRRIAARSGGVRCRGFKASLRPVSEGRRRVVRVLEGVSAYEEVGRAELPLPKDRVRFSFVTLYSRCGTYFPCILTGSRVCGSIDVSAIITFGLNALSGRRPTKWNVWVGDWDSRNAYDFLKYTIAKGYPVDSWEFGMGKFLSGYRETRVFSPSL